MKILQINKFYHPWIGGVEKIVQNIAEDFNGRDGFRVDVLACQAQGRRQTENINGITVYRAASWGYWLGMPISWDFFRLLRKIKKNYDLILIHHPFPLAFLAIPFLKNKKIFIWYHADIIRQKISKHFFLPFIKLGLKRADKILLASRSLLAQSSLLKKYVAKSEIIPFGLDLEKFSVKNDDDRQTAEIKKRYGSPLILGVGRLVSYKGWEFLITALADDSLRALPEVKLLIIGAGPLETELNKLIADLELQNKVSLLKTVPDLKPFYEASDLLVLPSVSSTEAFGLVQLEAMACGKPVINTDLPTGVTEVSLHGLSGLTVPPRDSAALAQAILKILSDPELKNRFGKNGRQRVEDFFSQKLFHENLAKLFRRAAQ
ncbi:TPA: hypothetical protein DCZ15_02500 [Candidatus Falkowbacteria bacterium]|nr:MAG: Mannosyltransferase [Candidatus Falkowbacteria bacterium GW2011_GWF2_43_32]HBA36725.1 hypothetical protein [Candidatus Falkowbacteria bacterium]